MKEIKKVAMNIVNQLFDLAEVPVDTRQRINDQSDEFVCKLLSEILPAPLPEASDTATMDKIIRQIWDEFYANDCQLHGPPEEGEPSRKLYAILQQRPEETEGSDLKEALSLIARLEYYVACNPKSHEESCHAGQVSLEALEFMKKHNHIGF